MPIPSTNTLTLYLSNTMGMLTLTPSQADTVFRLDSAGGLSIPGSIGLSTLWLTGNGFTVGMTSGYAGSITVGITLGVSSALLVGGDFVPGTVIASWIGQAGGPEPLVAGSMLAID